MRRVLFANTRNRKRPAEESAARIVTIGCAADELFMAMILLTDRTEGYSRGNPQVGGLKRAFAFFRILIIEQNKNFV